MEIFLIACLGVLVVSAMTLGNRATARAQEWTAACAEYERKKEAGTAMKVADMQELALLADFRCELQELLEKVNDQGLNTVLSVEFSSDAQTLSVQPSGIGLEVNFETIRNAVSDAIRQRIREVDANLLEIGVAVEDG